MDKKIIGRKDVVDFPSIGLNNVQVKIDSGAFSSSIHCEKISERTQTGNNFLEVVFLDQYDDSYTGEEIRFENYKKRIIKSSNGVSEERFIVELEILLFSQSYRSEFSLTRRNDLKFPVLLGRKLLNKRFIIDTSKSNLSFKAKIKK
ncbi:MAG: ATP-dependent zinc protease [Flavobacteriia bacterium]|nr:ATP-dependent zinc protease [Flavobacteriia bacterium]OJX37708.1 MAG: peptidase [Flavobacteriia bacterium 40-80]